MNGAISFLAYAIQALEFCRSRVVGNKWRLLLALANESNENRIKRNRKKKMPMGDARI
jgi:hypothetical protein